MTLARQYQRVLELMFVGKTDGEIAAIIGATEDLVRLTVEDIVQALNAGNRFGAIYNALREGLLTPPEPRHLVGHGVELDVGRHEVLVEGSSVHLRATEFKLLEVLMAHPGRVFDREQIIDRVKGQTCVIEPRSIDVHIRRLREALGKCGNLIESERGFGYRFRAPQRVAA